MDSAPKEMEGRGLVSKRMRRDELVYALHRTRSSPLTMLGLVLVGAVLLLALLASFIAPYGPSVHIWNDTLAAPGSGNHFLGTDNTGMDVFSKILYAYRLDLLVALSVVGFGATFGTLFGSFSGFSGGRVDDLLMRIADIFLSIPSLILALAVAIVLGRTVTNLVIALAITWWPSYARLIRSQVISEKNKLYVGALRSLSIGRTRILLRHVLPNSIFPVIVSATLDMGSVLLNAAALSFLGFGVQPGAAELGRMVADGYPYIFSAPWTTLAPGVAIVVVSLGFNLMGDGLRDILDPRLRR